MGDIWALWRVRAKRANFGIRLILDVARRTRTLGGRMGQHGVAILYAIVIRAQQLAIGAL